MKENKSVTSTDELTEDQVELLQRMAAKIVRLRMTTPAIFFLESVRPMNYVGSQVMVFFAPLVRGVFNLPEWDQLQVILEKRSSISRFLDLVEEFESDHMEREKRMKAERKAEKRKKSGGLRKKKQVPQ